MRMYTKLAVTLVALTVAFGCSKKDDGPTTGGGDPWATGGTGGSNASGGTGGSSSAGTGGTGQAQGGSSQAGNGGQGQGGSSQAGGGGQAHGGQGGQNLDGGVDAYDDSGPDLDALPDVPIPGVDTCPTETIAFGTRKLLAGGETPSAFADAYNAEVAAMTNPGPMLIEMHGMDNDDPSAKVWKLEFGPLAWDGSAASFAGPSAEIPFDFQSGWGVYSTGEDASFTLHFDGANPVDIPVVRVDVFGGSLLSKDCDELAVEQLDLIIPQSQAKDIAFHGSTVSGLMGDPNRDCCGGKNNAWILSLATMQEGLAVVPTK